jgi:aquaglyceroporin related protein
MATAKELSYPPGERPKSHDFADEEHHHVEFAPVQIPNHHDHLTLPVTEIPTASSANTNDASHSSHKSSSTLRRTRSALGLHPEAPLDEEHDYHDRQKLWWSRIRITMREPFAEFWGVVIMVLFGDGSVAQVLLSTGQTTAPGGNGFGAYQSISWG